MFQIGNTIKALDVQMATSALRYPSSWSQALLFESFKCPLPSPASAIGFADGWWHWSFYLASFQGQKSYGECELNTIEFIDQFYLVNGVVSGFDRAQRCQEYGHVWAAQDIGNQICMYTPKVQPGWYPSFLRFMGNTGNTITHLFLRF